MPPIPRRPGIELVFTTAEEDGLRGAKEVDLDGFRSPFGFVLDHPTPIGEVITAAPTYKRLLAEFEGLESHSGVAPEKGRSAIAAAAAAVNAMELGRLDEETTANVGMIDGGNGIEHRPGTVHGGRRGPLDRRRPGQRHDRGDGGRLHLGGDRARRVTWTWTSARCSAGIGSSRASEPVRIAKAALERCGHEPVETVTGGGSDANALVARGFDCVLLANGTEAPHTPEESVAVEPHHRDAGGVRGDRRAGGARC